MRPSPKYFATCPSKRAIACAAARRYPVTDSRHSSESSCAAIAVEPTRSQNSTVRCRRSPTTSRVVMGGDSEAGALASPLSGAPHLLQNLEPGAFATAHDGHTSSSVAPHSAQKAASSRFSFWHFAQRISLLAQFVEEGLRVLQVGGIE